MTWTISTPRDTWIAQVKTAWAALEPHAPQGAHLRDLAAIDHEHFARLIEALYALTPGQGSQERQGLAGLRPVGEVLEMPDRGDTRLDAGGDGGGW